jgi:LacI family transcriptional regulator
MSKKSKVTITDVARAAGVAVGTVSRVFNNHSDVNPDIATKVRDTAHQLGYRRIRQRRGTRETPVRRNGATGDIGIIFFGMQDTLVQLPVVSTSLQGIESALSAQGRALLIANIPNGDRTPPFISEGRVEGLILKGPNMGELPSESASELLRHIYRIPHVWVMGRLSNAKGDHCNFDTDAAGRLVAEHLLNKGHKRVAFMNPKPGQVQFEKVKTSFLNHAARLGLEGTILEVTPPGKLTWPLPATTQQDNVDILTQRWAQMPAKSRPTAIFIPSDRTAMQLYTALERLKMRVGTDISVVSCNNEKSLVMNLSPTLTTIDVHADFIGRRAVDQLLWRIQHPGEEMSVQILVEPTLIERASVAQL